MDEKLYGYNRLCSFLSLNVIFFLNFHFLYDLIINREKRQGACKNMYWNFAKISQIEECSFNAVLKKFGELGIDGLVRENIQNSLDGRDSSSGRPVEVHINTGNMSAGEIPGLDEVREHINALRGGNPYAIETIASLQEKIKEIDVKYISFEDRNTKGLTGASKGSNFTEADTWGAYAYRKGMHHVEENQEQENLRGGSHGIGKIASNAASDINIMFFANCDQYGEKHLGGTVQLIEHEMNGNCYRQTGYFTKVERDNHYVPFENEHFADVFQKDTRGLKIIIPFLREDYCDEKDIVRSVCDNFFVAILRNELVVYVNEKKIWNENIEDIVSDTEYYEEQDPGLMKNCFTPLYVNTYLQHGEVDIVIEDLRTEHRFNLRIVYNKDIKKGRMAIVRSNGMKIEDKKITSFATAPFNAILLPASSEEDRFLKTLENESHTALVSGHIQDIKLKRNAVRFINNISKELGPLISNLMKEANPVDGKIDTSDIIYELQIDFKKSIRETTSTVHLTKASEQSEKQLVQMKAQVKPKKKKTAQQKRESIAKKIMRQLKRKEGQGQKVTRVRYTMYPESVQRIIVGDTEILCFDLNELDGYSNEELCNVGFVIIDGTGREVEEDYIVNQNYDSVEDTNTHKVCVAEGNIIKDVSIKNGKTQIKMQLSRQYNSNLKFNYFVEV